MQENTGVAYHMHTSKMEMRIICVCVCGGVLFQVGMY